MAIVAIGGTGGGGASSGTVVALIAVSDGVVIVESGIIAVAGEGIVARRLSV